jgi:hypothetical protein
MISAALLSLSMQQPAGLVPKASASPAPLPSWRVSERTSPDDAPRVETPATVEV